MTIYIVAEITNGEKIEFPTLKKLYNQNKIFSIEKNMKSTINNYLSAVAQYYKWITEMNVEWDIFVPHPKLISLYIQYRVATTGFSQYDRVRSSLSWFYGILKTKKEYQQHPYYINTLTTLQKLFKKQPDSRVAVSFLLYKQYAATKGVSMRTALTCDFDSLVDVTVMQIYSAIGLRSSELISKDPTKKLYPDDILIKPPLKNKHTGVLSEKYIEILVKKKKTDPNAKFKHYHPIGETQNEYYNPAYFFKIYLKRRLQAAKHFKELANAGDEVILKYYNRYKLLRYSKSTELFTFEDGTTYESKHFKSRVVDPIRKSLELEPGETFGSHCFRITLTTGMLLRDYPEALIMDYVGWKNAKKKKINAFNGYVRLTPWEKANLLKEIINKKIKYGHRQNNY